MLLKNEKYKPFSEISGDGKIKYCFNSLGYRSEEYNPQSRIKIFACGCSCTFGHGLTLEETWPYRFKQLFLQKYGLEDKDVNLMNFGMWGHSNDYISRTLLKQMNLVKPDLILVYFTVSSRKEYVSGNKHINLNMGGIRQRDLEEMKNYLAYYSDELGFINALKNMLLLQYYCKLHNIDYIFSWLDRSSFGSQKFTSNPICSQFIELIDKKYLCDFTLKILDRAADKRTVDGIERGHPGPKSNKLFAEKLFKFYEERILNKSNH